MSCRWWEDEEGGYTWWTDCNNLFEFTDGAPNDNSFKFCPFCGRVLETVLYSEPLYEPRGEDE